MDEDPVVTQIGRSVGRTILQVCGSPNNPHCLTVIAIDDGRRPKTSLSLQGWLLAIGCETLGGRRVAVDTSGQKLCCPSLALHGSKPAQHCGETTMFATRGSCGIATRSKDATRGSWPYY